MKKLLLTSVIVLLASISYSQTTSTEIPIGSVVAWAGNPATLDQTKWKICDGSQISKDFFPELCAVLGNYWGPTDADPSVAKLFYLPDLRGMFLRGVNQGRSDIYKDLDADSRSFIRSPNPNNFQSNQAGSYQADALKKHKHSITTNDDGTPANGSYNITAYGKNPGQTVTSGEGGDSDETRPNNAYVYWIIRAK